MTEDQMREAMLEDAKQVRKRAKDRDGTNIYLKQNLALITTWAAETPNRKQKK